MVVKAIKKGIQPEHLQLRLDAEEEVQEKMSLKANRLAALVNLIRENKILKDDLHVIIECLQEALNDYKCLLELSYKASLTDHPSKDANKEYKEVKAELVRMR